MTSRQNYRVSVIGSRSSKVSVIMVYHANYGTLMETALKSLRSQTHSPEVVLVRGDGQRLARSSNQGCMAATGKYLVRIDSDDWVEPDLIESEAAYLDAHPGVDCVWCDFIESRELSPGVFALDITPQEEIEHACGAMFRREVWEALRYDESLDYQEGYDFWCRFKQAGYVGHRMSLPAYYYRRHGGSMSTNPARQAVRERLERKYANR